MNLFTDVELEEERARYPAPTIEACTPLFRSFIERFHAAMLAGNTKAAKDAQQDAENLVSFVFDEMKRLEPTNYQLRVGEWFHEATAAPDGEVPMWGQSGNFVITVAGVPVRIEMDGLVCMAHQYSLLNHFSIHVVEPRRPFLSSTGYRSCFSGLQNAVPGMTLTEAVTQYLLSYFKAKRPDGMGGKLDVLNHWYRDRALGLDVERSDYDHQGNRNGSPEAIEAARKWAETQAKYAKGPVLEEDDDETDETGDEDGGEDVLYCDECTADLTQLDTYFETACGNFCPDCNASHRATCPEDHGDPEEESHLLPGMEHVDQERAEAAAEAEGESLSDQLLVPLPSISGTTREVETFSPLFRESSANQQLSLF